MNESKFISAIYAETMADGGFLSKLREGEVDETGFENLVAAIRSLAKLVSASNRINRLAVACLFEVPWEVENTVPHFKSSSPGIAGRVNQISEELREEINELLWTGLESEYTE